MASEYGKLLLNYCTDTDPKSVSKFLAQHNGLDILNARNNAGNTPLLMAAMCTREPLGRDCMTQLLNAGATIDLVNKLGNSALHTASKKGYATIVDLLAR